MNLRPTKTDSTGMSCMSGNTERTTWGIVSPGQVSNDSNAVLPCSSPMIIPNAHIPDFELVRGHVGTTARAHLQTQKRTGRTRLLLDRCFQSSGAWSQYKSSYHWVSRWSRWDVSSNRSRHTTQLVRLFRWRILPALEHTEVLCIRLGVLHLSCSKKLPIIPENPSQTCKYRRFHDLTHLHPISSWPYSR